MKRKVITSLLSVATAVAITSPALAAARPGHHDAMNGGIPASPIAQAGKIKLNTKGQGGAPMWIPPGWLNHLLGPRQGDDSRKTEPPTKKDRDDDKAGPPSNATSRTPTVTTSSTVSPNTSSSSANNSALVQQDLQQMQQLRAQIDTERVQVVKDRNTLINTLNQTLASGNSASVQLFVQQLGQVLIALKTAVQNQLPTDSEPATPSIDVLNDRMAHLSAELAALEAVNSALATLTRDLQASSAPSTISTTVSSST